MIRPYMGGKAAETITGTEPINDKGSYFFPNPNKGILNWDNNWVKKVDIYSVQGNLMQTINPENGSQSAPVTGLPDGMYVLKVTGGKRSFVQKMLIVK